MPDKPNNPLSFWQELKRRKVIRVITVYAAAAWVILEFISNIEEPFGLPDWTTKLIFVILCVGLIISIILSWIYDITPEGIEKTKPSKEFREAEKTITPNSWRIATYVSVVIIAGLIAFNIFGGKKGARIDETLTKSIAVLPFHNLSGDDSQEFICVGLTDEIISHLFKVRSFEEVRSLTSVLPFTDSEQGIKEIAQELQVNYILEGSYKRMGDELKITAQLIESKSDNHIWLHDYELPYSEVIGIPGEIALQIADHLKAFITVGEKKRIEKLPTNNPEAYQQYLLGISHYWGVTQEEIEKGIHYLNRAIQLDPSFAMAYVYLAYAYHYMARYAMINPEELYPKAMEAVRKAIELDDSLGEAYAALGLLMTVFEWDFHGPEAEFQRAIRLSPNSSEVYTAYADYLRFTGRYEENIKIAKKIVELNPRSNELGSAYVWAGKYDESIKEYNRIMGTDTSSYVHNMYLAYAYALKGSNSEAVYYMNRATSQIEDISNHPIIAADVGWVYGKAGKRDKAEEILAMLHEAYENGEADPGYLAQVYIGMGDRDRALEYIQIGYEIRSGFLIYLNCMSNTSFRDLNSDPRFTQILEKIGFEVN
jgi:TolB-like protein/Tfp pilus assembly protein PilF